ncbi:unnamed protein product [Chrysoparadoxa australica]
MWEGWLASRAGSPAGSVGPRRYCVLIGAALYSYESASAYRRHSPPCSVVELIGCSVFEGSLVYVTAGGHSQYCTFLSPKEKEEWLVAMKFGVEMHLGQPARVSEPTGLQPGAAAESDTCQVTGVSFGVTNPRYNCSSCGCACTHESCSREIPLPQHGMDQAVRVCTRCFLAQHLLCHLSMLNNMFACHLHERQLALRGRPFALAQMKKHCQTTEMEADSVKEGLVLLEKGLVREEEFGRLLQAEQRYQRDEAANGFVAHFQAIAENCDDQVLCLVTLLMEEDISIYEFQVAIVALYQVKLHDIDFYWPQLVHALYQLIPAHTLEGILKVELLEDFLLWCCRLSAHLALKLIWLENGYLEDITTSPVADTGKQVNLIRLCMELEELMLEGAPQHACESRHVQHSLIHPTGSQSSLLAGHLLRLQHLRARVAAEYHISYKAKLWTHQCHTEDKLLQPPPGMARNASGDLASYFENQLVFVQHLVDIAERLRFVEPPEKRQDALKQELAKLETLGLQGYVPCCKASDPICPIVRVPANEGHVFKTKARAPTLITCETACPRLHGSDRKKGMKQQLSRGSSGSRSSQADDDMRLHEEINELLLAGKAMMRTAASAISLTATTAMPPPRAPALNSTATMYAEVADQLNVQLRVEEDGSSDEEAVVVADACAALAEVSPEHEGPRESDEGSKPGKGSETTALNGKTAATAAVLWSGPPSPCSEFEFDAPEDPEMDLESSLMIDVREELKDHRIVQGRGESARRNVPPESPASNMRDEQFARLEAVQKLFDDGVITEDELRAVLAADRSFVSALEAHHHLDLQFCAGLAFGESWAKKKARIKAESPHSKLEGWDITSIIVKSNDDLRQEVLAIQLIELCCRVFAEARLSSLAAAVKPYMIIACGASTGLMQTLTDASSLDSLKKRPTWRGLEQHFKSLYGEKRDEGFKNAREAFISSVAAYSLICYCFSVKDRHNGNILLDTEGHLVHIDFGFLLGLAPGGAWSIETSPFKLTTEMVEVMGGLESPGFDSFVYSFTCGYLALQANALRIIKLVAIMGKDSPYPCFQGKDIDDITRRLRERLRPHLGRRKTIEVCVQLIKESYANAATSRYDWYQNYNNGIAA